MFTLRAATQHDSPFIAALEREVMAVHARALWGEFRAGELSAFDLANTRIVEQAALPLGYLMVERAEDHLRLRKLYILPAHQGKGLGRRLLALVRAEAERCGLPLRLSVLRPNTRALAFYLREGLQVVEVTADRAFLETPTGAARAMVRRESATSTL